MAHVQFILFIIVLAVISCGVHSTEDIEGHSDVNFAEAKKILQTDSDWMSTYFSFTQWRDNWLVRLVFNLISYSTILIPCFLVVKFVKKNKYLERSRSGCGPRVIRLFVEGYDHLSMEDINSHKSAHGSPPLSHRETSLMRQTLSLGFYSAGLLTSYLVWGVLQERVMVYEYSSDDPKQPGERFTNSQFIVFTNRVLAFLVAMVGNQVLQQPIHKAPAYKYIYSSFSNIMSSWCQYEALKFVSFPVQVLAKTSKVIPVMLMGKLVSKKSYSWVEYLTAAAISMGVFLFLVSSDDGFQGGGHASTSTTISGVVILLGYLAFDSFTSNWQDEVFTRYKVSPLQMMAGVNFFSVLLTSVSLLEQGTLTVALAFMYCHPIFSFHVLILSLTSAVGQLFIFATIARFGPVTFTIIMTIRQGLAILLSCIIYGHQVTVAGALGVTVVFLALFIRIYLRQTAAKNRKKRAITVAASSQQNVAGDGLTVSGSKTVVS